jgi:rod shape-determining protein MreC
MTGEKLITSGLDGIYPEGLQIGYVTDVRKKSGELFQVIEVATTQNLNAIEEVAILKR